jgi:hypothetical protein
MRFRRASTAIVSLALGACGGGSTAAVPDAPLADAAQLADAAPHADAAPLADAPALADAAPPMKTGADPASAYVQLASDLLVANGQMTVLSTTIDLPAEEWVLATSDGRFFPNGASMAEVHITIDGTTVSNLSTIDWSGSLDAVQHSFNAVGAKRLGAGSHTIALVATPTYAGFTVGSGSNLSVVIHPAARVTIASLSSTAGPFNFDTLTVSEGDPAPHQTLVTESFAVPNDVAAAGPLVALASGGTIRDGHDGDAMFGIYLDGVDPGNGAMLWSVNDTCQCAEEHAPLYTHGFLTNLASGSHSLTLEALELPWAQTPAVDDPAIFQVGDNATLVTLSGDLTVAGSYASEDVTNRRLENFAIATSEAWPNTPPVGTDVMIAESTFAVPVGHTGVVMFLTKSRVQADASDPGGLVRLWLELDGQAVGSTGIQQLAAPFSVSQRTISASYLATGAGALAPGQHTIRTFARCDGQFIHMTLVRDLPLVWFD